MYPDLVFLVFWMLELKSNTGHVDKAANAELGPEDLVPLLPDAQR